MTSATMTRPVSRRTLSLLAKRPSWLSAGECIDDPLRHGFVKTDDGFSDPILTVQLLKAAMPDALVGHKVTLGEIFADWWKDFWFNHRAVVISNDRGRKVVWAYARCENELVLVKHEYGSPD